MTARCSLSVSTCPGKTISDTYSRISVSNQSKRMSAFPPTFLVSQHFKMASRFPKSFTLKHPLHKSGPKQV